MCMYETLLHHSINKKIICKFVCNCSPHSPEFPSNHYATNPSQFREKSYQFPVIFPPLTGVTSLSPPHC